MNQNTSTKPTYSDYGTEVFSLFKDKEGSYDMATPLSIARVIELAKDAQHVLELGAGIGTMTYGLLKYTDAFIEIYEDNEFCREQLSKNLKGYEDRYKITETWLEFPKRKEYDLIVLDNAIGHYIHRDLCFFHDHIVPKIIHFEGIRRRQRKEIRHALSNRYTCKIERIVNDGVYKGGTTMRFTPAKSYLQKVINVTWCNFREHEKMGWLFGHLKPRHQR